MCAWERVDYRVGMPTRLMSVVFDAADPAGLAGFWAEALGWSITVDEPDEVEIKLEGAPDWGDGGPPALVFVPVNDPKAGKNRVHLDLASASLEDQHRIVDRLLEGGARRVDIGQEDTPWFVLADPEGNEFCVLDPRPEYQADRSIAAVVLDCLDPAGLAPLWHAATGWPVQKDRRDVVGFRHATAPSTWLELLAVPEPKRVKNRLHPDVAPYASDDHAREVARLEGAGARRVDIGQGDVSWIVLADPEGNEFCLLSPR